jgi:hypothetical protein
MAEQASPEQVSLFIRKTDEWYAKYLKLISPEFRAKVYATRDSQIISAYESEVNRATGIKTAINATVGTWAAFKRGYAAVTDVTSTVIGDVVDWFRGIFGGGPAADLGVYNIRDVSPISGGRLGAYNIRDVSPISGGQLGAFAALGAIPIITAIWITGILALLVLSLKGMDKIFIWVDAWAIKRDDPTISTGEAIDKAAQIAARGGLFAGALPLLAAAAIAAFLIFGQKK